MTSCSPLGCLSPTNLDSCHSLMQYSFIHQHEPPSSLPRDDVKFHTAMWDNDVLANCTSCGIANGLSFFSSLSSFSLPIDTTDVNNFYSLSTGYSPLIPGSDLGGDPTAVLKVLQDTGFKINYPGKEEYSYTYPAVFGVLDYTSRKALMNGIYFLGFVYGAFALTLKDKEEVDKKEVWDDSEIEETLHPTEDKPWSWGGHVMIMIGYTGMKDSDYVTLVTWGEKRKATWRWVKRRLVASYGISFPELFNSQEVNFIGLTKSEINEFLRIK